LELILKPFRNAIAAKVLCEPESNLVAGVKGPTKFLYLIPSDQKSKSLYKGNFLGRGSQSYLAQPKKFMRECTTLEIGDH